MVVLLSGDYNFDSLLHTMAGSLIKKKKWCLVCCYHNLCEVFKGNKQGSTMSLKNMGQEVVSIILIGRMDAGNKWDNQWKWHS